MTETPPLSDDFLRQLMAVGEVDIVVGVPTFNNRQTIERVVSAVQVGLTKYFHRERCVLVNPDGGSTDGTPEMVRNSSVSDFGTLLTSNPLRTFHRVTAPYHGIPGKETALRTLFTVADLLRAKACAVLAPDSLSITPEWVENLIRPIYREEFDFVAPVYQRQKFDGLLARGLLSPAIAALYGRRLHEPVGSELAVSGRLAGHFLGKDIWNHDLTRFGLEIWMTTTALTDGFRFCESFLGPKVHAAKQFGQDVAGTIRQVVGALFECLQMHESYWKERKEPAQALPIFGFQYDVALEPLRLSRKRMLDSARSHIGELVPILESILAPQTLVEVRRLAQSGDGEFHYSADLWVKTVYEFAAAWRHSAISRDHLLQALPPLYRAWTGSFVLEHYRSDAARIDQSLETLAAEFERRKDYLVDRWAVAAGGAR